MAIDDNTLYGLTGSQVKDLADKVVQASDEVINIGNLNNFVTGNSAHQELLIKIANAALKHDVAVMQVYGTAFRAPTRPAYIKENGNFRQLTWSLTSLDNSSSSSSTLGVGYNIRDSYTWTFYVLPSEVTAGEITHVYGRYSGTDPTSASSYTDSTVTPSASTYDRTYTVSASGRGDIVGKDNVNQWTPTTDYGLVHKKYVDSKVSTGAGAPTTSTVGIVGQIYQDTTEGKIYVCTAVTGDGGDPEVFTYTWAEAGSDNSVYLTRSGNTFPLAEGSDELKGLCKILNNFLFHNKKAFTVVFGRDGNNIYQISQDMNVLSPSTAYVPIILICENSRIRTNSGSNYYGIMYHSCSPQTVQLYVPRSEYDSQNIQNIYSDYQLTSRSLQLRNDGEAWTVDNISTGPLGTANTQSYTPTQNYHPATKKYVDDIAANIPVFTMTTTDPGEGQPLADNNFIAVYAA